MQDRYYDPYSQKFLSEDPIGFSGHDVNFYRYVNNRPLILNDPTGELAAEAGAAIVVCFGVGYAIGDLVYERKATNACVKRTEGDKNTCRAKANKRSFPENVIYVEGEASEK